MDVDPPESNGPAAPSKTTSGAPTISSKTRKYRPYFTSEEVTSLNQKQGAGFSHDSQEKTRQLACTFIEAIGLKMGFPRKTIATAQTLYHRFRLFFPLKSFDYPDVVPAAIYVSAKLHDTLKKPQDILEVGYTIRFPHKVNVAGLVEIPEKDKAKDRTTLLAVERMILEMICFNFTIQMAFPYVIKLSKELKVSKDLAKLAWRLCADRSSRRGWMITVLIIFICSYRTVIGLLYPPHTVALASIYLAGLLATFEVITPTLSDEVVQAKALVNLLSVTGDWETRYLVKLDDLNEICHSILDLLVSQASAIPQSYHASPVTPSSPSPYPSPRTPNPFRSGSSGKQLSSEETHVFTASHLTRLKIALRKQEATLKANGHAFRKRAPSQPVADMLLGLARGESASTATKQGGDGHEGTTEVVDKNEGTTRFLFGLDRDS